MPTNVPVAGFTFLFLGLDPLYYPLKWIEFIFEERGQTWILIFILHLFRLLVILSFYTEACRDATLCLILGISVFRSIKRSILKIGNREGLDGALRSDRNKVDGAFKRSENTVDGSCNNLIPGRSTVGSLKLSKKRVDGDLRPNQSPLDGALRPGLSPRDGALKPDLSPVDSALKRSEITVDGSRSFLSSRIMVNVALTLYLRIQVLMASVIIVLATLMAILMFWALLFCVLFIFLGIRLYPFLPLIVSCYFVIAIVVIITGIEIIVPYAHVLTECSENALKKIFSGKMSHKYWKRRAKATRPIVLYCGINDNYCFALGKYTRTTYYWIIFNYTINFLLGIPEHLVKNILVE